MAIGDKLFIADKPTLDAVKEDTTNILQGVRSVNEVLFANAGDSLLLGHNGYSISRTQAYKDYLITIKINIPYIVVVTDKFGNLVTQMEWVDKPSMDQFLELDDNILLFYSGMFGPDCRLRILNLNTVEWSPELVVNWVNLGSGSVMSCLRYVKEEKRLYRFAYLDSSPTTIYLHYLDMDIEAMTAGSSGYQLAFGSAGNLQIAELIKMDRGYYLFAYNKGNNTINYFYEVSDLKTFIESGLSTYTRRVDMGYDQLRTYSTYYQKKYLRISNNRLLILTRNETWVFDISTPTQKKIGYFFITGASSMYEMCINNINLLAYVYYDSATSSLLLSLLLTDIEGNPRIFEVTLPKYFYLISSYTYYFYPLGGEDGLYCFVQSRDSTSYKGSCLLNLTKYWEEVLKICGY